VVGPPPRGPGAAALDGPAGGQPAGYTAAANPVSRDLAQRLDAALAGVETVYPGITIFTGQLVKTNARGYGTGAG